MQLTGLQPRALSKLASPWEVAVTGSWARPLTRTHIVLQSDRKHAHRAASIGCSSAHNVGLPLYSNSLFQSMRSNYLSACLAHVYICASPNYERHKRELLMRKKKNARYWNKFTRWTCVKPDQVNYAHKHSHVFVQLFYHHILNI